jgi:hypothetical protein
VIGRKSQIKSPIRFISVAVVMTVISSKINFNDFIFQTNFSLINLHLFHSFLQFAKDLFDGVALSWHFDLSPCLNPNMKVGSVFEGQVRHDQSPMIVPVVMLDLDH